MARTKDCKNPKKRQKSVILTELNFLILKEIEKSGFGFNFNRFVNDCIVEKLYAKTEKQVLQRQIENLADERTRVDIEYGIKAEILARKLKELDLKESQEEISIQVEI